MKTTRIITATAIAAALAVTLGACSTDPNQTAAETPTPSMVATTPATEASEEAVLAPETAGPEPVADAYSQVIGGVLYAGTEDAPVKIGSDVPGQAPAAEATFPGSVGDFEAFKAAAIAIDGSKYTVLIAPVLPPGGIAGESEVLGYQWGVFRVNEYGNWKSASKSGTFATKQEAVDAPKTIDGRVLDRSEYVLADRT